MIEVFDCEQGSDEWYAARLGIPTASEFAKVLAKGEGKTRRKYMLELAGEALTGAFTEGYSNYHMERGHEMEGEARQLYAFANDVELTRVGFVRNGAKGASPDSLIGKCGGLEIKTAIPSIQVERLLKRTLPPEHRAQVQGNLWVTERNYWDFVSFCPRLPLFTVRVHRDNKYIADLAAEVERFNQELAGIVQSIRNYEPPRDERGSLEPFQNVEFA